VSEPFVVRQFEGRAWVTLEEAARLNDAVQEAGVTIAALRNEARIAESRPSDRLTAALERAAFALSLALGATYDDRSWLDEAMAAYNEARVALAGLSA
jgi:hypothetical protein